MKLPDLQPENQISSELEKKKKKYMTESKQDNQSQVSESSQEKKAQRKETNITSASEEVKEDHPPRPHQSSRKTLLSIKVFGNKYSEC